MKIRLLAVLFVSTVLTPAAVILWYHYIAPNTWRFIAYTVDFHLPNDFVGPITLRLDRTNGVDLKFDWRNRKFVVAIPSSGQLNVRSLALFSKYHKAIASYRDGRQVATYTDDMALPKDVAVRLLGSRSFKSTETFFFVGTLDESQRYKSQLFK